MSKRKERENEVQSPSSEGLQVPRKLLKREESAADPTLLPQVFSLLFHNINPQKKYYRQRAHANVLSDHALV